MLLNIKPGELPFVSEVNLDTFETSYIDTKVIINPIEMTISFELSHFSSFIIEQKEEWKIEGEKWCRENPCKCNGLWEYEERPESISGCKNINDCQYNRYYLKSRFYGGPCGENIIEETYEIWEYSEECKPEMELATADRTIPTNGETIINANISICKGLENQKVELNVDLK